MQLFLRLLRASLVFGYIFLSYMLWLGVSQLVRTWERDPKTNRDVMQLPRWMTWWRDWLDRSNARRLLRSILRLRGVYIKLGQVLSIMGGFLPRVYTKELEALQDQ